MGNRKWTQQSSDFVLELKNFLVYSLTSYSTWSDCNKKPYSFVRPLFSLLLGWRTLCSSSAVCNNVAILGSFPNEGLKSCKCRNLCNMTIYSSQITFSNFPNKNYFENLQESGAKGNFIIFAILEEEIHWYKFLVY